MELIESKKYEPNNKGLKTNEKSTEQDQTTHLTEHTPPLEIDSRSIDRPVFDKKVA